MTPADGDATTPANPASSAKAELCAGLRDADSFNCMAVSWSGPDETRTLTCSYCDAELRDGGLPLVLWNEDGWCAEFCTECQRRWWGLTF